MTDLRGLDDRYAQGVTQGAGFALEAKALLFWPRAQRSLSQAPSLTVLKGAQLPLLKALGAG